MGFQPLTGVVAQALAHVMLEEVIVTLTPIVLEILNVEVTIAEEIIHQQEVTGQMLLIAAKVSYIIEPLISFFNIFIQLYLTFLTYA